MDGILIVDKPQGMTSHDVVDLIRRRFGIKKVGHAGTLDPMATGLLVMLIGSATKLSNSFMQHDKEYEARMRLGGTSDTGDAWGKVIISEKEILFSEDAIRDVFRNFTGRIAQVPPMYSAVKYKGKKLYELARQGMTVKMDPKEIVISEIEIRSIALPDISFRVRCSKGTYVRQLCVDIGASLGCGAYLTGLIRTRSGDFHLDRASTVEELRKMSLVQLAQKLYQPETRKVAIG